MGRHFVELNQQRFFISPSQEEIFQAVPGWNDGLQAARIIDDTPSQPAYPADSAQSSPHRGVEVSGSSLSEASQQAVECASPEACSRRASDPVTRGDSYNEAFESDRSQSPTRRISWGLAHGGEDPKSPASTSLEQIEEAPLGGGMVGKVGLLVRQSTPAEEGGVATAPATEVRLDEVGIEDGAEDIAGTDAGNIARTADDVQSGPSPSGVLVSPRESVLVREIHVVNPFVVRRENLGEGFGSGSASAFKSLKRKNVDPPAGSGTQLVTRQGKDGSGADAGDAEKDQGELGTSQVVQNRHGSLETAVIGRVGSDKEDWSFEKFVQDGCEDPERLGDRGIHIETDPTFLKAIVRDELESPIAGNTRGVPDENASARDANDCTEVLFSPKSLRSLMDTETMRSVEKLADGTCDPEGGYLRGPLTLMPPRAVREKLDKLRSHRNKRVCRENSDHARRKYPEAQCLPTTVLDVVQLRSGQGPAPRVSAAAELLKTALHVGISLPPPFHRNYFRD